MQRLVFFTHGQLDFRLPEVQFEELEREVGLLQGLVTLGLDNVLLCQFVEFK
jgi:hypothetical protein